MTIPPHYPNEQLREIEQELTGDIFSCTENLRPEDFQLIGAFVQMYNFIEFNLRRSIEIFAHGGLISHPKPALRMAELIDKVKSAVEKMGSENENITDSLARLNEIELRREFRNLLAHWAAKRIIGKDALILFSQDSKDLQRTTGKGLEKDFSGYCIINLADIRGLVTHLASYERWIAEKVSIWHAKYTSGDATS